jgi:hypothetical protein
VSPTGLKWAVDPVADVVTTAGDLIYGTAADTVTRLGIGTAGQVLKVNSGATAPEWGAAAGSFAGCRLTKSGTQTISTATATALTFDTESYDTDGYHSTVTNTSRITIPSGKAGKYFIYGKISYGGTATVKHFQARIHKNGTLAELLENDSQAQYQNNRQVSSVLDLAESDYVELFAYQETGGNSTVAGATTYTTTFAAAYLGA